MDQPLRVYLMDDDLASATHVLSVLEELPWVQVVGGMSNPMGALREIPELAVDAIFLDVELPGMSGFELLGRLPVKPAVVIVAKPEPQYAHGVSDSGGRLRVQASEPGGSVEGDRQGRHAARPARRLAASGGLRGYEGVRWLKRSANTCATPAQCLTRVVGSSSSQ